MYLIYINRIGTTFKGEHIFEFLFSDSIEWEWDDSWYESSVMTDTRELAPNESIVKLVGNLKTDLFDIELVQEDGVRDIYNAVEGIIALGWEKIEEEEEVPEKRRVFNFGDTKESVDEQLYEYDLVLKYKENKITRDV
jgi:hypothetical protein|tara:strand:- start:6784 stop:7197 length:414 start_codon:yes stop_codon:yes gene_type:complete